MKFVILTFAVCAAAADRLQSSYLPPSSAKSSSGSGLLAPPRHHGGAFSSGAGSSYVPPASGPVSSERYNTPSVRTYPGQTGGAPVAILRFDNDNAGDGTYRFEYETENRISQQESGQLQNAGTDREANVVRGTYSYAAPDGVTYTVNYIADENGFRASGDHLPTPPPAPEAIQRSLEINRSGYSSSDSVSVSAPNRQYLQPNSGYNY